MATPYVEAIQIIEKEAFEKSSSLSKNGEIIPISSAIGRICFEPCYSPMSTPAYDTSAMDGFAVDSSYTLDASHTKPVTLCVKGTMAAGDARILYTKLGDEGYPACIEIMTGAQIPLASKMNFDACVRVEDTRPGSGRDPEARYIEITKPVQRNQNRRLAGTDFRKEDLVISTGTTMKPHHIMALSALGIREVSVFRRIRIGIMSTGSELISHDDPVEHGSNKIRDCNGPYIDAVLTGLGVEVTNFGIVQDKAEEFALVLSERLQERPYDMIITTGAVSKGKFDFVSTGLEALGAKVCFHGVAIRPGHPVLFAMFPRKPRNLAANGNGGNITPPIVSWDISESTASSTIAFFGLPGNPLAAAACLRFLVIPYLRAIHSLPPGEIPARKTLNNGNEVPQVVKKPAHLQAFWHGKICKETGAVSISSDQGSYKLKPMLDTDCWVGVQPGRSEVSCGDEMDVFEMYPMWLGL